MDMQTKDKLENLDEKIEVLRQMRQLLVHLHKWKVPNCLLNVCRHVYLYLQSSHQQKVLRVYPQARHCEPLVSRIVK